MKSTNDRLLTSSHVFPCALSFADEFNDIAHRKCLVFYSSAKKLGMDISLDHSIHTIYLSSEEDRSALLLWTDFVE